MTPAGVPRRVRPSVSRWHLWSLPIQPERIGPPQRGQCETSLRNTCFNHQAQGFLAGMAGLGSSSRLWVSWRCRGQLLNGRANGRALSQHSLSMTRDRIDLGQHLVGSAEEPIGWCQSVDPHVSALFPWGGRPCRRFESRPRLPVRGQSRLPGQTPQRLLLDPCAGTLVCHVGPWRHERSPPPPCWRE